MRAGSGSDTRRSTGTDGVAESDSGRHGQVLRGIAWTTVYRLFEILLGFGAMLLLVRIIAPADYGRAGTVVGLVTLLNAFSCSLFMAEALQRPDGVEPDWTLHWSAGFYIQLALALGCQVAAGVCWLYPPYFEVAPLMHLAGLGVMIDWPNWMGGVMLRRELNFRRLQLLNGVATFLSLGVTLGLGVAGAGAYALVFGGNVARALPFGFDLLLVRRWRPASGWWRWPDWSAYRPALRFGFQQSGSALLHGLRGALEAAVLPGALGFAAIGLFSRAQALSATTVGRVGSIVIETVYPLLPRYAANGRSYPRQATLFLQIVLLCAVPGAVYIGIEGPALSRLLYGERWVAADPLIRPSALIGVGQLVFLASSGILLAANRLRVCFLLDVTAAVIAVLVIGGAWTRGGLAAYVWIAATGYLATATIAVWAARRFLVAGWPSRGVLPALVSSAVGGTLIVALEPLWASQPPVIRLCASGVVFALGTALALRSLFPQALTAVLSRLPGGQRFCGWLRLQPAVAGYAAP
jgi:O-antigen/teichoic acid export membrane protein